MRIFERLFPVLALVVPLAGVVWTIDQFGSAGVERVSTEALIRLVFAIGLYIFAGNSGIVSFGHMTFCAIAAYATAWQTCCAMLKPITMSGLPAFIRDNTFPLLPAALTSIGLAGVVAFTSGLILMRLSSLSASISTLALMFILNVIYSNWTTVTMGSSTIVGLPVYVTIWIALGCAALVIVIAYLYQVSRWGLMLRATREDEVAAQASGTSLYWSRLIAFTLSGFVAGLAGVLFAHFMGTVSIANFFLNHTFLIVAMLVIGGMQSLAGAVVGVTFISVVIELFRRAEVGFSVGSMQMSIPAGSQELILAGIMLLILIFRKAGIMGGKELRWPWSVRDDGTVAGVGQVRLARSANCHR
ncbi:branched-chain amino acid ABC transporter permease [Sinorhizobium americanum]|uniref:Branched-chain amino acid ABC transporter permease n=1 Tax=Sinorhizobium americanum TaxID=194963 RepID=A0A1L3LYM0_9HYPH|nr:branched-chain amino acid ABC transporter permease [Sinorhizobium americanum]APG86542.1 branched-chain amino acid ABC transporter permease [Sinorhizobium americanum CCGM7]APG95207.1 branched-chain amino acid ABC transporter permease [Sinorhizobium americanum]OAP39741.1 branched-chain amino acid ABC transporter permease [Sinorhizobium americanum]